MSKGNTTENDIAKFIFNAVAMPSYGGNLYIALHTADPGEAGVQNTSECAYTSYARVLVTRDSGGFTVTGPQAVNAALVQFPTCTGSSETATHFSVGIASSGATQILYSAALNSSLAISNNVTPQFAASALQVTED